MDIVISFPVLGSQRMQTGWPIKLKDRHFELYTENGFLKRVKVNYTNLPTSLAPSRSNIGSKFSEPRIISAEYDIRAWQSILSTFSDLEIDYDNYYVEYIPANDDEKTELEIINFSSKLERQNLRGNDEFAVYGRAFLAIDEAHQTIPITGFYLEATKAIKHSRFVDAYNNFYLFFEAYYKIPFKTTQAIDKLYHTKEFTDALIVAIDDTETREKKPNFKLNHIYSKPASIKEIIKQIVNLRGALRHNSLGNPDRWDPLKQDLYESEATFLGLVAYAIIFPITMDLSYTEEVSTEFLKQTEELGNMTDIRVSYKFRDADTIEENILIMRYPVKDPSPMLAKSILEYILQKLETERPGTELFLIVATLQEAGVELFRYSYSPTINP